MKVACGVFVKSLGCCEMQLIRQPPCPMRRRRSEYEGRGGGLWLTKGRSDPTIKTFWILLPGYARWKPGRVLPTRVNKGIHYSNLILLQTGSRFSVNSI